MLNRSPNINDVAIGILHDQLGEVNAKKHKKDRQMQMQMQYLSSSVMGYP